MSDAGESSDDDRDGHRVEYLYTGQDRSEIPRGVTHVRVDPSAKRIAMFAFEGCRRLEEAELLKGVEEISGHVFRGCKRLKRVRMPPTVKRIGDGAFRGCEQLRELKLCEGLKEIGDCAFFGCKCLKRVRMPHTVKRIGHNSFEDCKQLEEVELHEGLDKIGQNAFIRCKCLKRVRIPPTVKRVGEGAFAHCEQLEEAELCEGLEDISEFAFSKCSCLERVRIPPTLKRIGEGAFQDCERLDEVELCEELLEIGDCAFISCASLERVRVPPAVKRIGEAAFAHCERLEEAELCEGLKEVGEYVFAGCPCLKRVRIPSTVKKIDKGAFQDCEQLERVLLYEGLEEIGGCAFENCFSLRNMSIPSSLKHVGARALRGCHDIRKIFGSQNVLDALRWRLHGLPAHRLCYFHSHLPAPLIVEQLQDTFDGMADADEAWIPAEPVPAHEKGDGKRAAAWSGSSRKLKARRHSAGGSGVAGGGAAAGGKSRIRIILPNQDCLGMTPLHILACSTKQNLELYQLVIANRPKCLITEDKWGCLPIFYAIRGGCSPEILRLLIDSHKSTFPDIDLNWDMMVSTLCRGSPLHHVRRFLKVKQASFAEQSVNFQRAARELTIHCLGGCESFDEDFSARWEFMIAFLGKSRATQGLLGSLSGIQESFFPDYSTTAPQALCEELVKPLRGWWDPESTASSSSLFRFLVRCSIPERLRAMRARKWQKDIERLVERNSSSPLSPNDMDAIHSTLVYYECKYPQLKEQTSLIELALWKSKMGESIATRRNDAGPGAAPEELGPDTRAQRRINCGAEIIIPNVLPYLIADAEKENVGGSDEDTDGGSGSEEDSFEDGSHEDDNGGSSSDEDYDEA